MKFIHLLNLVGLTMAAPKASAGVSLSNFDSVVDTSDPFITSVWDTAVSFKEGDEAQARSVEASSEPGLERRACDRKSFQLCIAVCNTGCAVGCKCGSCFSLCPGQCRRDPKHNTC